MPSQFRYCNQRLKLPPARYEEHGGAVFLVNDSPDCGPTQTIVSSDPAVWRANRHYLRSDKQTRLWEKVVLTALASRPHERKLNWSA
jgi:hypothetical protein